MFRNGYIQSRGARLANRLPPRSYPSLSSYTKPRVRVLAQAQPVVQQQSPDTGGGEASVVKEDRRVKSGDKVLFSGRVGTWGYMTSDGWGHVRWDDPTPSHPTSALARITQVTKVY